MRGTHRCGPEGIIPDYISGNDIPAFLFLRLNIYQARRRLSIAHDGAGLWGPVHILATSRTLYKTFIYYSKMLDQDWFQLIGLCKLVKNYGSLQRKTSCVD